MKKTLVFLSCIMAVLVLSGCSMANTPTRQVENFLNNYNSNDKTVLNQLQDMVNQDGLMNDDQRSTYTDIMKTQYKDLTYDIKDEVIDGDNATVTAEIEVYDYYKVNQESQNYYNSNPDEFKDDTNTNDNNNNENSNEITEAAKAERDAKNAADTVTDAAVSSAKYVEYRLNKLKDAKDRVKYTIDFTLTKKDDKWVLNDIDDATRQKIHGLYAH